MGMAGETATPPLAVPIAADTLVVTLHRTLSEAELLSGFHR
jgi:hypothetical protein